MARTLTHAETKAFYDRFGARQDSQAFYEDRATDELIAHGAFAEARAVFEFGCGTGRFAARLLAEHLPPEATYHGVDISDTMVELARARLAPWRERAAIALAEGSMRLTASEGTFDRFVSNYVCDLLSEDDIRGLIAEAHRVLTPDGRLCLTGLTFGQTPFSRIVTAAWRAGFALNPKWLGGCRPIRLLAYLDPKDWEIRHHAVVERFGIACEAVVASRRGP